MQASGSKAIWLISCLITACGGGASTPVKSAGDGTSDESLDDHPSSTDDYNPSPEERVDAVCADETCSPCGDGFCPTGYYCDESAAPPICSWLPACADEASCACVERALGSNCRCESKDGGTYVTCS